MNKTQTEILRECLRASHGLTCVHTGYFVGARRGSYGSRRHNAAKALRDAGLLVLDGRSSGVHHFIGNVTADHHTETTWRITDAGRAALESRT